VLNIVTDTEPVLGTSLDAAANQVTMENMLVIINQSWAHYEQCLAADGFKNYMRDRNSLVAYDKAVASQSTRTSYDVQMSKLTLRQVYAGKWSLLKILYWTPDAAAIKEALLTHFQEKLEMIVSSLVTTLGKIRAMLEYFRKHSTVSISEKIHIQPIFQVFLQYLYELCGWGGRTVRDARAGASIKAFFRRCENSDETFKCSGHLDVLGFDGEWDPCDIDSLSAHLIAELKRPFDDALMVGKSNGAAAQTMAQCEWLLHILSPGKVVTACATDLFALAPHLALMDETGHTVHLIGRRVSDTVEYVHLLLYLCMGHSKDAFESIQAKDCCELNAETIEEFGAVEDDSGLGFPEATEAGEEEQKQDENREPDEKMTRSGKTYKRAAEKMSFNWDDHDDDAAPELEQLRLWNERFQGYRGLRMSDVLNRPFSENNRCNT